MLLTIDVKQESFQRALCDIELLYIYLAAGLQSEPLSGHSKENSLRHTDAALYFAATLTSPRRIDGYFPPVMESCRLSSTASTFPRIS